MNAASLTPRLVLAAVVAGLTLVGSAGAVVHRGDAVVLSGPKRIVQNEDVSYRASVRTGARCTLTVRYRTGSQRVSATSKAGSATFDFKVARRAAPGGARVTVACGSAGTARMSVVVIGGVVPAKINVVKSGFSHRPRLSGSVATWGVILSNETRASDAVNVVVLANFVLPDETLIGSMTKRVSRIRAGSQIGLGGDLSFPGYPPITRLEVVVQVSNSEPSSRVLPAVANAHAVPSLFEPAYVGSLEGEVANDRLDRKLLRTELSAVVLDAEGNILGGGTGAALASLPPGSRQFFKITGLYGVPVHRVASVLVSVNPTWDT